MSKRKGAFRAPSVNLKSKLRSKKPRTNTSDASFFDRIETTSTSGVPSSTLFDATTSEQNPTYDDMDLDIPGSFPVDEDAGGSRLEEEEPRPIATLQHESEKGKEGGSQPKRRRTVRSVR
ncbi:hypothetical protein V5O48_003942 [Marasmius crinis-equi]|uniref:Uncharacterized protein n=1 Tax=Marasmius crinis-equi TaxID=585013 RepID=A0ABR3FRG4_9AGAR